MAPSKPYGYQHGQFEGSKRPSGLICVACSRATFLGHALGCATAEHEEVVRKLVEALQEAAKTFRVYERIHLAKGEVGTVRAQANRECAETCEHALAAYEQWSAGEVKRG